MENQFYCIDLDSSRPEVLDFSGDELQKDLDFFNVQNALELSDYDRKVFKTEAEADTYLSRYFFAKNSLDNNEICKSRKLPAMLYKRRYIVQTLLGEKLQTFRHYKKNWKPGQLFNLHDQTYFLTVELISITKVRDNYCYKFKLPE